MLARRLTEPDREAERAAGPRDRYNLHPQAKILLLQA